MLTANGIHHFRLNGENLLIITDGEVPYDNNCFAPDIPREEVNAIRGDNAEDIILTHNILIIKKYERVILIDAGNGPATAPAGAHLLTNLLSAGITAREITDILLTHAHPDHIGGLVNEENQPVFPAAAIHLSKAEYDFWQNPAADFSHSKHSPEALKAVQQQIQQILSVVKPQLHLFQGNWSLMNIIRPIPAPGHTPGHMLFSITLGSEQFIHMGDICHEELLLFSQPGWGTIFDVDFELAAETRFRVLNALATLGKLTFGYHMPWPGFGKVVRKGTAFAWQPVV
ncbi:MBL fold metallo-hydrolase [Chitinophaga sp. Cy-1792]|uniref:MBL fold metallo-hydrolase n=1 Tax=Chitinophaga sp. Cy-1792 TaxID=2608339 RepID=UPI0014227A7D|nr:MBL fold metallo-hydrolase [Chitinophaga sp. Cy-1792]